MYNYRVIWVGWLVVIIRGLRIGLLYFFLTNYQPIIIYSRLQTLKTV